MVHLITVVVFGQKPDSAARLIAGTLGQFGAARLHTSDGFEIIGRGILRYCVEAVCRLDRLMIPGAVLILTDQSAPRRIELDESTAVIAGTDNRRMRRLFSGHLNPVVTCGTGPQDTLTVSSVTPDRAVLCAQRELPTVSGAWLEPAEFAVELHSCSLRPALLAAGTAAVCGCPLDNVIVIGD